MSRDEALFRAACRRVEALAREPERGGTGLGADEIVARVLVELGEAIDIRPYERLLRHRLVQLAAQLIEAQGRGARSALTAAKRGAGRPA